ncbi:hypothetical protein BVC93_27620 [Mycobacterium sp. MS1601]|nr:hypothetical protein BVC93_27620 [Mycobacterium sp. MS1601]
MGRVLASPVRSQTDVPAFDNAAMDGFAVSATVVAQLTYGPVDIRVVSEVPAGAEPPYEPAGFDAHQTMTGGPVHPRTAAVIPVERSSGYGSPGSMVRLDGQRVTATNIRRQGEDVKAGQQLLAGGTLMTPAKLAALSAAGHARAQVIGKLRTVVVASGNELVPASSLRRPGQTYESNAGMIAGLLTDSGCQVRAVEIVGDDVQDFRATCRRYIEGTDLFVTIGGISAGTREVVRQSLSEGVFQHIAMRPGAAQGFGHFGDRPVICLPGNPVSAFVSFVVLVEESLRARHGLAGRQRTFVRLMEDAPVESHRDVLLLGRKTPQGRIEALGQGRSASINALAGADHLVKVPAGHFGRSGFEAYRL